MHLSSLSLSKGLFLISLLFLAACTDYVQQMDDGFDEWEKSHQLAELSSSSQTEMSSSSVKLSKSSSSVILSGDSHEKSSNSNENKISSSSEKKTSSSSTKSNSSNKVSSSSEQKNKSSSSVKTTSSSSKITSSSSLTKSSSSSVKQVSSSSSKKNEVSSTSENANSSSSIKSGPSSTKAGSEYNEELKQLKDLRDGHVYRTTVIGTQIWMAENLNYDALNSHCYADKTTNCDTYGRLYTWATAMDSIGVWSENGKGCGYSVTCSPTFPVRGVCPENWHLPDSTEWSMLFTAIGGGPAIGLKLKSSSRWHDFEGKSGNGSDSYSFTALPAGEGSSDGIDLAEGEVTGFWSSSENHINTVYRMCMYHTNGGAYIYGTSKHSSFSVRCVKDEKNILSSSSKPSWAYLNPAISYGEIVDDRDGQVYKTVVIDSKTWMAENLNYESVKSYCYENKKDSCSKYGHLYIWSAAMDSIGAFSTNSKGCGYPNECHNTKNPVRGVCPEKWHIPSQQEWYDLSTYNSSTIREDLSSAGERLKSANGWFNSGNGDNTYGFSVLPAGTGSEENYSRSGEKTCFWSSSDGNGIDAYGIHFEYSNSKGVLQGTMKSAGCSIRCVKD